MKNLKIFFSEIFFKLLSTFSHQLTTLISIPLLANLVEPIEFGKIMTILIMLQLSWTISEWGIPNFSIEFLADKTKKINKINFLNNVLLFQLICFFIIVFLIFISFKFIFKSYDLFLFFCMIPSLFFGIFNFAWFFTLINKSNKIFYITFISRILFLFLVYFFVSSNENSYIYLLAHGLTFSFIFFYSIYLLKKENYLFFRADNKFYEVFYLAKKSFIFFLTNLSDNQFSLVWAFFVSAIGGPILMAIYSLSDQIYRAIIAINVLISQTIRINLSVKDKYFKKFFYFLFTSSIVTVISLYFFIEDFLNIFFNKSYSTTTEYSKYILIPALIHFFIRILNYPVVAERNGLRFVNNLSLIMFFINCIFVFLWILFFTNILTLYIFITIPLIIHLFFLINSVIPKIYNRNKIV